MADPGIADAEPVLVGRLESCFSLHERTTSIQVDEMLAERSSGKGTGDDDRLCARSLTGGQYSPRGRSLHLPDGPSFGRLSRRLEIQFHGVGASWFERFRKCPVAKHAVLRMGDREAARAFGHEQPDGALLVPGVKDAGDSGIKGPPGQVCPEFQEGARIAVGIKTGRPDIRGGTIRCRQGEIRDPDLCRKGKDPQQGQKDEEAFHVYILLRFPENLSPTFVKIDRGKLQKTQEKLQEKRSWFVQIIESKIKSMIHDENK